MKDTEFEIDFNHGEGDDEVYIVAEGTAYWDIQNDSFDYAGTHCTHGQAGTCHLPDYAIIEDVSASFAEVVKTINGKEVVEKISWQNKESMKAFEKEWGCVIEEHLQESEDDNGDVIQSIKDSAEEAKYEGRI